MENKKIKMIGNAHIDPVWLWNWQEGYQEVKATFKAVLDIMNEDENFYFTCSSSIFFEWIEKSNPKMFEEITKRVKEGRIEIVGGWLIQPDCNIPNGESFVRQGLYGQRYFLEKFGIMAKTGYNVDSFGHAGTLPQILKKSGMDNYVFMRPGPHEKALPARTFWWEAKDKSKVLAYRIPYEYCTWGKELNNHVERVKSELKSEHEMMVFYGVGNHGGGPTRDNIRSIYDMDKNEENLSIKMSTTNKFFEDALKSGVDFPTVQDDFQHHAPGCYSVYSEVKSLNRKSENNLLAAEKWSVVSKVIEGIEYPDDYQLAWKGVLFNQFHDILAGTSIKSAYDDSRYLHCEALAIAQRNHNLAVQSISWDIDIEQDIDMKPIVVFNNNTFSCKHIIDLEVRGLSDDNFKLLDEDGNIIPSQCVKSEATVNGQQRVMFVAEIPALGYRTFKLYPKTDRIPQLTDVKSSNKLLENKFFKVEFNEATGYISSMYDKLNDVEVFKGDACKLNVILDDSDTWSHGVTKFDRVIESMKVDSMKLIEDGEVRSTIKIKYKYKDSTVTQYFSIYKELEYVTVKVVLDWREPKTMLKLNLPTNMHHPRPTYETPYGFIEKSANGEEEPGQSFVTLQGNYKGEIPYGITVANDAKYSYSFDNNNMNITILKNSVVAHHEPKELDEDVDYDYTDFGIQEFNYYLYPHKGNWKDNGVVQLANILNQKPTAVIETFHKGTLPQKNSFLSIDTKQVVITALKEAEDKCGVVLRAYETNNFDCTATITISFMDRKIETKFSASEIKTIYIPYDNDKAVREVNMLEM